MGGLISLNEQDPDLELVRDLASGDPDARRRALGLLYERHGRRVFNVSWRVLGDWSGAQDVTQEVFAHLADRLDTFRGDSGLRSWLYRVTVNRSIDVLRRDRRRPAWKAGDAPLESAERRPSGDFSTVTPEDVLEREAVSRRIRDALDRLSPKLRAIVVLRYLEGLTYEDLSDVLDCSMGTVKSRLSRAHSALRRLLGPWFHGTEPVGEDSE